MPLSLRREIDKMFNPGKTLHEVDPELWAAVQQENQRQEDHIELIASENYASPAVMAAQGSQLTNKYAEGDPGKRYYGGVEIFGSAEDVARDPAEQPVGAEGSHPPADSGARARPGGHFAPPNAGGPSTCMSVS